MLPYSKGTALAYKDTVDDFNLKWSNSYAFQGDELVYVFGAQYDEDEESKDPKYFVSLGCPNNGKRLVVNMDLDSLTPILIDSQFFNSVDLDSPPSIETKNVAALLFSRNPRRQNKRSVCGENTTIHSPLGKLLSSFSRKWSKDLVINFHYVQSLLATKYPSYLDALEYCKKHVGVAISPDFAVGLSPLTSDGYILMSKFGFIGTADSETLRVKHKGSMQEVTDFVSRNRIKLRVVDATSPD